MFFVIAFCIVVVFFGCLASLGKMKHGLEAAFLLIILFSAFRFDYGTDYPTYYERFHVIARIPNLHTLLNLFDSPFDKYEGAEMGWILLNWFFKPIGFSGIIIFTSIITNFVYYKFIKTFVPQKWYWLALFTYIFNTGLFFVPLSMMRQSCGMVLFVFAFKYIAERRILISLLIILIAILFHKSALVLLPFTLLGFLSYLDGKYVSLACFALFGVFMLSSNLTSDIVNAALLYEFFEGYDDYFNTMEAGSTFGFGLLSRLLTFFVPFIFYGMDIKNNSFRNRLAVLFASISVLIIPFTLILGFLGRISYYFSIFDIVAVPLLYSWMKNKQLRLGLLVLYIVYIMYNFFIFFTIPYWVSFTHYQTIFG